MIITGHFIRVAFFIAEAEARPEVCLSKGSFPTLFLWLPISLSWLSALLKKFRDTPANTGLHASGSLLLMYLLVCPKLQPLAGGDPHATIGATLFTSKLVSLMSGF
ncbi:hypothetical protein ACFX4S_20535 [Kosakonia sp. YIM B13605]|uniref:hypothetical protein n=1 Tax=Kosakonia TaxID=1330547 RepID=UPI0032D8D687